MPYPTSESYFNTPQTARSTQSSRSSPFSRARPSLLRSPRSPGCISALNRISAQLVDEDPIVRFQCLANCRITNGSSILRCRSDCSNRCAFRPRRFRKEMDSLNANRSIEDVDFSGLMRYFFCQTHGEGSKYNEYYRPELEYHWYNSDPTMRLEALDAIRNAYQLLSTQSVGGAVIAEASIVPPGGSPTDVTVLHSAVVETLTSEQKSPIIQGITADQIASETGSHFTIGEAASPSLPVPGVYGSDISPCGPCLPRNAADIASEVSVRSIEEEEESSSLGSAKPVSRVLFGIRPESAASNVLAGKCGDETVPGSEIDNLDSGLAGLSLSKRVSVSSIRTPSPLQDNECSEASLDEEQFSTPGVIPSPTRVPRRNRGPITARRSRRRKNGTMTPAQELQKDHLRICAILRGGLKIKEAFIYILSAPDYFKEKRPGRMPLLKVGYSANAEVRLDDIERTCFVYGIERVQDPEYARTKYFLTVEKLVHLELKVFQRDLFCDGCRTRHTEWFEVTVEVARRSVQLWQRFVAQDPFHQDGKLKDAWKTTLNDSTIQMQNAGFEDYEQRHERWAQWVERGIAETAKRATKAHK